MKALVIGATGTIGSAVSALFSQNGFEVVEASRSSSPALNISEPSTIDQYFTNQASFDAIVCAAGSAAFAPLHQLTDEQVHLSITSKLLGQVNIVRKGLARLHSNGVFVLTGGMLAYVPSPQTAMLTLVNSALEGFVKAAALDLTDGKRIVIVHPPWVAETAAKLGMDASKLPDVCSYRQSLPGCGYQQKERQAFFC